MRFLFGFILGISLISCAAAPIEFTYRFYHLGGNDWAGRLLGRTAADDKPFIRCAPVDGKQQCVVVFYSELNRIISDYKQTKRQLIDCQRGK